MSAETFGLISPHPPIFVPAVGGKEAQTAAASLAALERARDALVHFAPEAIVLMSPHAPAVYDAFLVDTSSEYTGSLEQFGDSQVYRYPGDPELAQAIVGCIDAAGIPVAPRNADARLRPKWLDHASIVPLSFIEPTGRIPVVVLSLSYRDYADHRRVGQAVAEAAARLGRRVAFLASGDMSHRLKPGAAAGFSPRGAELDEAIVRRVQSGEFEGLMDLDPELVEAGGECGLRSLITLGGFSGPDPVPSRVLSYEGPWGVGYLTALVGQAALANDQMQATEAVGQKGGTGGEDHSDIVRLARKTIESWVREGEAPAAELDNPAYPHRAGAFVSLHRDGMLRGCIGTIGPTRPTLAEEVAANAIQAATEDPRFPPLQADELADLDVKVDVLHAPESCTLEDLDPTQYGVIVSNGPRRGLLLPDLEGVDDIMSQVSIAMQKAGIPSGTPCDLHRFKVDRYT
jgi:AmmeMemoRadiSam system protein A